MESEGCPWRGGGEEITLYAPMPRVKVAAEDLSVRFADRIALSHVTLGIQEGQVQALIGPSGCGKTTFLRTLNRMSELAQQSSHTGDVKLDGRSIFAPDTDPSDLRRRVGMVFQRPNPFPMSVLDNVTFGPRRHGIRNRTLLLELAEESLAAAGLWEDVKDRLASPALSLATGEQQRLCIARALAVHPEVLLMDEPTSALDPVSTARVEDLMRRLAGPYTVVLVTHSLAQAGRVADRVAFFLAGSLIEEGTAESMFTRPQDARTEAYLTGRFA